jgi:hypothetical protein
MCDICNGSDPRELLERLHETIERNGWAIQAVGGDLRHPSWAYTIGLTSQGPPELIVYGCCLEHSHAILTELAPRALNEWGPEVPSSAVVGGLPVRLVPVDRSHWRGDTFAMWLTHHRAYGVAALPRAVQVLLADDHGRYADEDGYRSHPQRPVPLLSEPRITCGPVRRLGVPAHATVHAITPRGRRRRRR